MKILVGGLAIYSAFEALMVFIGAVALLLFPNLPMWAEIFPRAASNPVFGVFKEAVGVLAVPFAVQLTIAVVVFMVFLRGIRSFEAGTLKSSLTIQRLRLMGRLLLFHYLMGILSSIQFYSVLRGANLTSFFPQLVADLKLPMSGEIWSAVIPSLDSAASLLPALCLLLAANFLEENLELSGKVASLEDEIEHTV